jgi:O-antigen ligase
MPAHQDSQTGTGWPLFALLFALVLPLSTALTSLLSAGVIVWAMLHWRACLNCWSELHRQPLFVAMLTLCLVVLVSTTITLASGIDDPTETLGKHSKWLLFFPLLALFRASETRRMAFAGFGLGVLASLLTSLYSAWSGQLLLNAMPGDYSTFRTHTYHNIFLAIGCFALVSGLLDPLSKRLPTWLAWLGWLMVVLALYDILFLVKGRTGQIVLLLLAGLLLLGLPRRLRLIVLTLGLTGVFIVVFSDSSALHVGFATMLDDLRDYPHGNRATSTGLRLDFYQGTWQFIQTAPLFGHGTGSFTAGYADLIAKLNSPLAATDNPHSDYLFFWSENGLPGLLAIVGLYASLMYTGFRYAQCGLPRLTGLWLSALGISYSFTSLGNSFLLDHTSGMVFVVLLAALLASAEPSYAAPEMSLPDTPAA